MKTLLKFNICELDTSHVANGTIRDLEQRIKDKISEALRYSCLYWATHLTEANRTVIGEDVTEFFRCPKLLFWLEVLSITKDLRKGLDSLRLIAETFEVRRH